MLRPANHTTSVINSAKTKAKNSIEKKYFAAYRKPDAKEGEEVVLPDEVKAQMGKRDCCCYSKSQNFHWQRQVAHHLWGLYIPSDIAKSRHSNGMVSTGSAQMRR